MARRRQGPKALEMAWLKELRQQEKVQHRATDDAARHLVETGVRVRPNPGNSLLRGMMAHHRGHLAEERLVRLLNQSPNRPPWLIEAQRGPADVDSLGVDVVVLTRDLGPIPLQVKSSVGAAEEFRRRHPDLLQLVGVVVAPLEMADADAWAAAVAELERLRAAT